MTPARVAVTGYMHEVNAFAPPVGLADGRHVTWEAGAAVNRLRELRDVEVVDLPVWEFGASGPLLDEALDTVVSGVVDGLHRAGPVDGVLVLGHGAGRSVSDRDADGTFLRAVREVVGPDTPLVMVVDFHANVSAAMCDLVDALVGYRTNPHVDIEERSVEAAEQLHRLLDGDRTVRALCRPPMVLPQLAQNTLDGEPLAKVRERAEAAVGGSIRNVSFFGGFSLADVEDCGFSVVVTADDDASETASELAAEIAELAWSLRLAYRTTLTDLDRAVEIAREASAGTRPPVIMADTADNPGGGAPGNSTFVLEALLDAGVDGAVLGVQTEAAVVAAAWDAGVGATVTIEFNADCTHPLARPLNADAVVLALVDEPFVPTKGVYRAMTRRPGRCCALQIAGVQVAVSSRKIQCADDDTFRHVGLDPAGARVTVVKSRGHFRAGFGHLFSDDQIVEVGAPGMAPAVLDGVELANVPRPVFPLDDVAHWSAVVTVHGARVRG